jgi:hypothetical protein
MLFISKIFKSFGGDEFRLEYFFNVAAVISHSYELFQRENS